MACCRRASRAVRVGAVRVRAAPLSHAEQPTPSGLLIHATCSPSFCRGTMPLAGWGRPPTLGLSGGQSKTWRIRRSRWSALRRRRYPLSSIFLVALLTAALGGVLADQATWASAQGRGGSGSLRRDERRHRRGGGREARRGRLRHRQPGDPAARGAGLPHRWRAARRPVAPGVGPAALVAAALSLDAVDGWLARRCGVASRFGARFDLEVDPC